MNIAILGFDVEGRASYDYFAAQGHELTICDQNPEAQVPDGIPAVLGEAYLDNLDRFDLLMRTAGLQPAKILEKNPGVSAKITTQINEFFKASPTKHIIGITGTKGKGTTSTLVTKMLEAAGQQVRLGGNIGVPPLTFLSELTSDSWVVLELSSFQLVDLKYSPHFAVCLMVVPEHLNWHADLDEYVTAKSQLFAHQTPEDKAIYFAENDLSKQIAAAGNGQIMAYYAAPGAVVEDDAIKIDGQEICKTSELKLLGAHNWQNVCAAVTAAWQATQNIDAMRSVLTSFSGLPYRLEPRGTVRSIRYFNDSFAATPPAAAAAIKAIPGKKIMILGGFDRQLSLQELVDTLNDNAVDIRRVLLIGASAERLAQALNESGFFNFTHSKAQTMKDVVHEATELAQAGDAIVLSPGFPSFDMFKNFEDRGQQFNEAVAAL